MAIIKLGPEEIRIEVPPGTLLFDAACRAGLPVASSCSSAAVCGKCVMRVLEGSDSLSPASIHEQNLLDRDKRKSEDRMSCMARVLGDCKVTTGYW
jgi:adenylate cyclase